jgi:hypothetical protein
MLSLMRDGRMLPSMRDGACDRLSVEKRHFSYKLKGSPYRVTRSRGIARPLLPHGLREAQLLPHNPDFFLATTEKRVTLGSYS